MDDFKFLSLDDIHKIEIEEKRKSGKIKPLIIMRLVKGEWIIDNKKSFVEEEIERTIEIPKQQWFNLKDACKLKGVNYKTICNKPYLKPNGGIHLYD